MLHETYTPLPGTEVLRRAKAFFMERVPQYGAYLEKEGPTYATFRGQGGEEITVAVLSEDGATWVRASSMLYDQAVGRFLSTLPAADGLGEPA